MAAAFNKQMKPLLATVMLLMTAANIRAESSDSSDWRDKVTESLSCTVSAEAGDAVLRVEMEKPDESRLEEMKNSEGAINGKKLPEGFQPGGALIKKFELEWNGKKIDIPEKFWADLAGFRIQESPLKLNELPAEKRFEGEQFLDGLKKPRVYISADGETIMIEWDRPEDCDGRSTIRWIINKSGTILRHIHTPPDEC